MAKMPKRKEESARRATQTIQRRTLVLALVFVAAGFLSLFAQLYKLQITQHDFLQEKAVKQQTMSTTVSASRGTIYDRSGNILAISISAETVFISPKEIAEREEEEGEKTGEKATYLKGQYKEYVARGLSRILGVEYDFVMKLMEKTYSQYEIVAKKVEQDVADEVRRFLNGAIDDEGEEIIPTDSSGRPLAEEDWDSNRISLRGIYLSADAKRSYPYHALASHIVGFVKSDNTGAYGLESVYEGQLQGETGLTISARDVNGKTLLYQYEQYYDAQNGNDLVLTIDTTIQYYLERGLEEAVAKYDVKNGATGIIMDVNTGALLAMASLPTYDLNSPSEVYDTRLQQQLALAGEEERGDVLTALRNKQWRNKTVNDTYEPGSTYKILTLAMALEEGVVTPSSTFNCTGAVKIGAETIHCSKRVGHGIQNLAEATGNSCNPAFISMGLGIGAETYYDYLEAFGLFEKTGVDLQGEVKGSFADYGTFSSADIYLACYAFGQTFTVTPLQLITAQAACVNGGYLRTPYVVEQVKGGNGNILFQHDSTPIRQVISEETSAKVCEMLEYVVSDGTGRNGQVAGYRIGGKTGTAEKTGTRTADNPQGDVVVSFAAFAPADDPQIIMLLALDTPSRTTGTFVGGGQMVAPICSSIMADILPYLGIDPQYSAEELVGADATVPNVVGMTQEEAVRRLGEYGFVHYRVEGEGEKVTDQTPLGGAIVPANAEIILYMGAEKPNTPCTVPKVVGLSASAANEALTKAGLIMKVSGATNENSSTIVATSQGTAEGTQVEAGTVIEVRFGDTSVLD